MDLKTIRVKMTRSKKTAYIALPGHPRGLVCGCVAKTLRLGNIIKQYNGPDVNLDFDSAGKLIGIEILVWE